MLALQLNKVQTLTDSDFICPYDLGDNQEYHVYVKDILQHDM